MPPVKPFRGSVSRPRPARGAMVRASPPLVGPGQGGQAAGPPRLALTLREAALSIGVSDRLLWRWAVDGIAPSVKVGGKRLFPVLALQNWLNRLATQPGAGQDGEEGDGDGA